jgi:hypothetical protein
MTSVIEEAMAIGTFYPVVILALGPVTFESSIHVNVLRRGRVYMRGEIIKEPFTSGGERESTERGR